MILEDKDILERINSSNNLMNRLKLSTQRSEILPTQNRKNNIIDIPSLPSRSSIIKGNFNNQSTDESQPESDLTDSEVNTNPTIDELIDDLPTKIKIGTAHVSALDVLNSSLNNLKYLVDEIESPKELANLAMVMHKIVHDNSRPKDSDSVGNKGSIVIWKPMMVNSDTMNVVQARE